MKVLHLIEPTLQNAAGHCLTLVHSLARAAHESLPDVEIHAWVGRGFDPALLADTGAVVHRHFQRRTRLFQLWALLARLTTRGERVFLPTAGRTELAVYTMLPARRRNRGQVWFYFHQLNMKGSGPRRLAILGRRIPDAGILCTHPRLVQAMHAAGFHAARHQPCPFEVPERPFANEPFRALVFPGEARHDKNLSFIAAIVRRLHAAGSRIPVMLQAGPNHHGVFPEDIKEVLRELGEIGYPHLTMPQRMMEGGEYLAQFTGGICLQPYQVEEYRDKISGITLDALARGCPCVANKGTWPAAVVEEFAAGETCGRLNAGIWVEAIERVIAGYDRYQRGCAQALAVLSERHHPLRTLETILSATDQPQ